MKISEIVVFIVYLVFMLSIGIYFFFKNRDGGEKTYFLGGRQMGPWVTALSAGASDMSAWVLMGLPTSIYALGLGQVWISVGLAIGYTISWLAEAPRLRRFSIVANDSITIPQYLTNRFLSKSKALQIICAVIFLVAYTVYAASSVLVPLEGAVENVMVPAVLSAVQPETETPSTFTLSTLVTAFSGSWNTFAVPSGENWTRRLPVRRFTPSSSVPAPSGVVDSCTSGT